MMGNESGYVEGILKPEPLGRSTRVELRSSWNSPGFTGNFLPVNPTQHRVFEAQTSCKFIFQPNLPIVGMRKILNKIKIKVNNESIVKVISFP
jgi:inner membrane protein involved in colicin E2 resistance